MKTLLSFSLGILTCLILSHTFAKNEEPENLVMETNLSRVLFKNCRNDIIFNLPEEGEIKYNCTGGIIIQHTTKNHIVLVPDTNSTTVTLNIEFQDKLYTQKYNVANIPSPEIILKTGGKIIDFKTLIDAPGPSAIAVIAQPNRFFMTYFPVDSRYKVTQWSAMLVRGRRPVVIQKYKTDLGSLSSLQSQAVTGDRIIVEVTRLSRYNFQGKEEDIPFSAIYNIPID